MEEKIEGGKEEGKRRKEKERARENKKGGKEGKAERKEEVGKRGKGREGNGRRDGAFIELSEKSCSVNTYSEKLRFTGNRIYGPNAHQKFTKTLV